MLVVSSVLLLAGIYLGCYVAHCSVLFATRFLASPLSSPAGTQRTRFAIVIPAHDEELLLPRLLASTKEQDYPRECYDTIVIADNCTDGTADVARREGLTALERFDPDRRGKGYAIKWGLENIELEKYDAVLIVDADCFVSANALLSLDGALGAAQAIQCYSGVGNPDDSWFTRLLDVSRTISNDIYSRARQRLGLSCPLIGTGMCLTTRLLGKHGWDAFTIGEDSEYYAKLIQGGETVGFDWDAKVYHQESSSLRQATSQRMRWSSGRFTVGWRYGGPLLLKGLRERSLVKFDAGLSLVLPNPSLAMNASLACLAVALLAAGGWADGLAAWFLLLALLQFAVFVVGVFYTKNRLSKFLAIFLAPAFLAWKFGIDALSVVGIGRKRWVRTERKL